MDSAKWQKIKNALSILFDLPENEHPEFLAKIENEEIRLEVKKLLSAQKESEKFINSPILIQQGFIPNEINDDFIGKRIENYQILERIGTGGMGAVYLAERLNSDFKQKVALKIIKRGMDSEAILQRFEIERRILSTLKHPNIAQLLDGGISAEGMPFFVMEYVDGKSLNQFCDNNNLSLNERLEIFRQICGAVDHAHKNLVIHRDLKPSNILVTANGIPKLLDFGIAKLLSNDGDEATLTATIGRVFTPEYASPEQVLGESVTTATDVYSLGVILYELLSGHRPFETKGKSFEEILKRICETPPTKPSQIITKYKEVETLNDEITPKSQIPNPKSLEGDLDNIILKALRKEPLERYGSVQQLAEDIARFLQGLPVLARAQTLQYRFGKYVKRHKIGVLAAALVLVSLIGGTSVATWQAIVARHERSKAEQRFKDVRQLANAVLFEYQDGIQKLPGSTAIREKMVLDGAKYLDNLAAENSKDTELQIELAKAYDRLGDIKGSFFTPSLGNAIAAKEFYLKGLAIKEKLISESPNDLTYAELVAVSYDKLADLEFANAKQKETVEYYQKAVNLRENILQITPENRDVRYRLMKGYRNIAVRGRTPENTVESLDLCQRAIEMMQKLLSEAPENVDYLESYGDFLEGTAAILETNKTRRAEAIDAYQKVIEIRRQHSNAYPNNSLMRQKFGMSYSYLGDTFYELGKLPEAIENYKKSLEILDPLALQDQLNEQLKQDQSAVRGSLAFSLAETGDTKESLIAFQTVIRTFEAKYANDQNDSTTYFRLAMAKEGIAKTFQNIAKSAKSTNSEKIEALKKALLNFEESLKIYKIYQHKIDTFPAVNVDLNEAVGAVTASIQDCQIQLNSLTGK